MFLEKYLKTEKTLNILIKKKWFLFTLYIGT